MKTTDKISPLLLAHAKAYPQLRLEDVFKFLHQSAFGCEHLVSSPEAAIAYIQREASALSPHCPALTEPLAGAYGRIHLGHLFKGLSPTTLGRLLCLSARPEPDGRATLEHSLGVAAALIEQGLLPFTPEEFAAAADQWRANGYPALHHSDAFRAAYHPAYRVIAKRYLPLLPLLTELDRRLADGPLTLAIEGGSASGKSTLGATLAQLYDCTLLHMDDFFLRPEQRTPERFAELGGNVDRERFEAEALQPLHRREAFEYRPFDCATMTLAAPVAVSPKSLSVIEGAYSMHPDLAPYYDLSVFLDISPELQRQRILIRNTPALATRFFEQWIPLENRYFEGLRVKERCTLVIAQPSEISL